MPQVDGIGLLKEIKKQEPDLNVIMISGHGNIHTAVTATKLGAFDFIEKPLSLDGLLLTVQRALGEAGGAEGKAAKPKEAETKRRGRFRAPHSAAEKRGAQKEGGFFGPGG